MDELPNIRFVFDDNSTDFSDGNTVDVQVGGVSINEPNSFDTFFIGEIDWSGGTTTVGFIYDSKNDIKYYFQLDGDLLPGFVDEVDFNTFASSITDIREASGFWAPFPNNFDVSKSSFATFVETDTVVDSNNSSRIATGLGNDLVEGNGGDDTLIGEAGDDTLEGGNGQDRLEGGDGNDSLDASGGAAGSQGSGDIVLPGRGVDTVKGHQELYDGGGGITLSFLDIFGEGGLLIESGYGGSGTVKGANGITDVFNTTFSYVSFIDGSQDGDTIIGSDDDHFEGFAGLGGADEIDGGNGFDVAFYNFEADFFAGNYSNADGDGVLGIIADMAKNQITDTQGDQDTLTDIEEIQATNERDLLSAADASEGIIFYGLQGNDTLIGSDFRDELRGGEGDDSINPGTDTNGSGDAIFSGLGNDTVDFRDFEAGFIELVHADLESAVTVNIDGQNGTGTIQKSVGTTTILNVSNVLDNKGSVGLDIYGTKGADTLNATPGGDDSFISFWGGQGIDNYNVSSGGAGVVQLDFRNDFAPEGVATDGVQINLASGEIANDGFGNAETIAGTGQITTIRTTHKNDDVVGSSEDDVFVLMAGQDTVDGGMGDDLVRFDRAGVGAVTINLTAATGSGVWLGDSFSHSYTSIENVRGSLADGDGLTGNAFNNNIAGLGGNDTIEGRDGADTLDGGDGSDTIRGGVGIDSIFGGNGNDQVAGEADSDWMDGGDGADRMFGGSTGDDTMYGGRGSDFLFGENGNDSLEGGDGFDRLNGGSGLDTIIGGNGDDVIQGNRDRDILEGGAGNDRIFGGPSGNDLMRGGDGNDIMFGESGRDVMFGDNGNDELRGGNGNDDLFGGEGNDTLNGGQGADRLFGGPTGDDDLKGFQGSDGLFGESGNDTMDGGDGNDSMNGGSGNDSMFGGNGGDTVQGNVGQDTLDGGAGNDRLFGGDAADELFGGTGNDTLAGERGNDTIEGGGDSDTFVFAGQFGSDTITDFDEFDLNEKIDLNGVFSITNYQDLFDFHMTDDGVNTTIDDLNGNTIVIENALVADLGSDDFVVFF